MSVQHLHEFVVASCAKGQHACYFMQNPCYYTARKSAFWTHFLACMRCRTRCSRLFQLSSLHRCCDLLSATGMLYHIPSCSSSSPGTLLHCMRYTMSPTRLSSVLHLPGLSRSSMRMTGCGFLPLVLCAHSSFFYEIEKKGGTSAATLSSVCTRRHVVIYLYLCSTRDCLERSSLKSSMLFFVEKERAGYVCCVFVC